MCVFRTAAKAKAKKDEQKERLDTPRRARRWNPEDDLGFNEERLKHCQQFVCMHVWETVATQRVCLVSHGSTRSSFSELTECSAATMSVVQAWRMFFSGNEDAAPLSVI